MRASAFASRPSIEGKDEVRFAASQQRTLLALAELRRKMEEVVSAGEIDLAAVARAPLSVEDANYRGNAGRIE